MRASIYIIILAFILSFMVGCKSKTVYVPIETVKTEYISKVERDSIHLLDSIFVDRWKSNDTVFITREKFKYLYRDKITTDSIYFTDSIQIPYPVIETKEVKAPYTWYEKILMVLGAICIGILGFKIYSMIRK